MSPTRLDPVTLLERAYDFTEPEDGTWLERIAGAFHAVASRRGVRGAYATIYQTRDEAELTFERTCLVESKGLPAPRTAGREKRSATRAPRGWADLFRRHSFGWLGDLVSEQGRCHDEFRRTTGVADGLVVNGIDATGLGFVTTIYFDRRVAISLAQRNVLTRAAAHVVAGLRARRAIGGRLLASPRVEAVLDPSGRVQEATGEAKSDAARATLSEAARAIDHARGRLRRESPEEAVALWKVLVGGRWSLLDHFERDGRRYLIACRNAPELAPHEWLTAREHQVVALAAHGHSNKYIAYELGISPSTVGVLICRAVARLGMDSRRTLVRAFSDARHAEDPSSTHGTLRT